MEYNLGDIVKTKKKQTNGNNVWKNVRIGVDFKLKCLKCNHIIVLPREKALKDINKKIEENEQI